MSGCDDLATKSDVTAIMARLAAIEAKIPDENRLAQKVADAVRSTMLAMQNAILSAINDSRLTVITKLGAIETVVLANLRTLETIIRELGVLISTSMNNLRDVVLGAINALRDILLELIKRFFDSDGDQDNFNYERIEKAIGTAHLTTRTLILEKLGRLEQFIEELLKGIKVDYDRIDAMAAKHHARTRAFIADLFKNFKIPPIDFTEILDKLDQLKSLTSAGIGSILQLLNTIWAFLQTLNFAPQSPNHNFDYGRIEKAIGSAHVTTRSIILGSIGSSTEYLASLILNLKLSVDYDRIKRIADNAAANTQNNINNALKQSIDYSRIQEIVKDTGAEIKGFTASIIGAYGGAILKAITEIKAPVLSVSNKTSKLIEKIYQIIGGDDYPITVPTTLISEEGKSIGTKQIPTLTQFFSWYVERFDELIGQFEIPIRIKDTDLVQSGEQSKTIKLPNLAESIAEMFMLSFQSMVNTETLINMCTRILFEGGQDKQQNFITYKLLYSLVDWAGYKTKDISEEMPLLFTPDKTNLSEILKETKVKVGTQVLDEKFGLEIDLMRFRKAAAVIDAVHFRKVNPFADIAPQIMAYLLGAKDTSSKVNEDKTQEDWEQFIEDAEAGFQNTTGISSPDLPYGKPFEERPRIRDLTQTD